MSHPIDTHESRCSAGDRALFHSLASGRSVMKPDFFVLLPPILCPACIGFPEEAASATSVKSTPMREPILSSSLLGSATKSSDRKEHTSELQSRQYLVCRLLLEKKRLG